MRSIGGGVGRWIGWCAILVVLVLGSVGRAEASTYTTGLSNCSGCHGVTGTGSPPRLPSQGSNILLGADLSDSCSSGPCSLRTTITNNANMGSTVANRFSAAELEGVRQYLVQVRDAEVVNATPSFANTVVGSSTTDTFSVTVRNYRGTTGANGSIDYAFSISGADFSIVSATGGTCAATANTTPTSCTVNVTVRFQPSGNNSSTRVGSLGVNVTATNGTDLDPANGSVALSANSIAALPGFDITPASRSFSTKVGTTTTQSFQISNPGTAPLSFSSFDFSSSVYTRDAGSTCSTSVSVAVGGNCTLTVAFQPTAAGGANGTLTVNHDAAGSPGSVNLFGTGTVPTISADSGTLVFGNSQLGVPKSLPAITLTNTGNADLVFATNPSAPGSLSGANPGDFSIASSCSTGTPLAPGGSCTVTGTFTPTALGARGATLTISSDASNGALPITLSGTGVALPEPTVTFPNLAFPDTVIGETAAQTRQVTITNDRTRDITYSVAATTDFKIAAESCGTRTVPGNGGSCTVTWSFQPVLGSGPGARQATVTFSFLGTGGDAAPTDASGQLSGNALLPIAQSATALNLAAVVGTPTTSSLLLTNRGASAVTLSSLVFSGAAAADYSLGAANTCTPGGALAGGANCSLVVRFDPPAAGTRSALLTITHTAPGSPQTVTLNGTATPAPQGRIELSALSLSFADTQLGSSSSQAITVRNAGNLALTFTAFNFGGSAAGDFTRGGTCSTATPLAINATCTLSVSFAPTVLGARSASLTISSDASNGPATLTLSGTGVPVPAPVVSLVPETPQPAATLAFGDQTVGGIYPARRVRLSNTGTADLSIASITVQGSAFANVSATPCPSTLAPNDGCDIDVRFAPAAANTDYTGSLRVSSNAAGSPHSVALRGRGTAAAVPVLTWSPVVSEIDFGNVSTGTVSAARSAVLLNQGPGGVTLGLLNAVGPGAASFSVAGGTCQPGLTLFQGQTCRVDVSFAPASAGARSASVQVVSDGSAPPALVLRGTGLGGPAPALALSLTALAFESTRVGDASQPGELTLRSSGSGVLRVTALAVTGPYTVETRSCPSLPFVLPAGSECTLSVSFVPTFEGDTTGTLTVTSDADPATLDVALSGHGEAKADVSSGGGCSIARGDSVFDPTLWTLVLLAAALLLARRRARRRA